MLTRAMTLSLLLVLVIACNRSADKAQTPSTEETPVANEAPANEETPVAKEASANKLVPIPNAIVTDEGHLLGGQPSTDQFAAFKSAGYVAVVNLRTEGEGDIADAKAEVEKLGMRYISIPVAGGAGMTVENAEALDDALKGGPAVVHCGSGNRVGGLFALRAHFVQGKSPQEALDIGLASGMGGIKATVRQVLGIE